MDRIQELVFVFPQNTESEREWGTYFNDMMEEIPTDNFESMALPRIAFRWEKAALPSVCWRTVTDSENLIPLGYAADHLVSVQEEAISIEQLHQRLAGKLIGMDHAGINIPTASMPPHKWKKMLSELAARAALYRYPGEDWPFILPAEEEEFSSDITNFSIKRTPKFELVYDAYTKIPIFQFALETDLTRGELEMLFPEPIGFAIPGLDEIFRSLFVRHPWERQMAIRFDLYYKSTGKELNDWETGEWLVVNGGRMLAE